MSGRSLGRDWATCQATGKRGYTTRKAARRAARVTPRGDGGHLATYRCDHCHAWHIGHQHGLTRSELRDLHAREENAA